MLQSTPWYADRALYVTLLGFVVPLLNTKLGLQLDTGKIAGLLVLAATYVAGHHYTSLKVALHQIERDAATKLVAMVSAQAPVSPTSGAN